MPVEGGQLQEPGAGGGGPGAPGAGGGRAEEGSGREMEEGHGWEVTKENFRPRKGGRRARGGGLAARDAGAARGAAAERAAGERRRLLDAVKAYAGEDPLEAWLPYLRWARAHDEPAAARGERGLVGALEQCLRATAGVEAYKADPRYLALYLEYADLVPRPADVFRFMEVHGIGREFAKYYEAYADFLEGQGNARRALATLELGLARLAFPVERLRRRLGGLQHRLLARGDAEAGDGPGDGAAEDENGAVRQAFSEVTGVVRFTGPPAAFAPAAGQGQGPAEGGLDVYCEEEGAAGEEEGERGVLQDAGAEGWGALGSQAAAAKENAARPSAWTAAALGPQAGPRPAGPALEVAVDPEFAPPAPVRKAKAKAVLASVGIKGPEGLDMSFEEQRFAAYCR